MSVDLDELEKVAKALAYPDAWHAEGRMVCSPAGFAIAEACGSASATGEREANAAHIAAFDPPTVLHLISRARRAEELEKALREIAAECRNGGYPNEIVATRMIERIEETALSALQEQGQ